MLTNLIVIILQYLLISNHHTVLLNHQFYATYISGKLETKVIRALTMLLTILNLNLTVQIYFQVLLIRPIEKMVKAKKESYITLF